MKISLKNITNLLQRTKNGRYTTAGIVHYLTRDTVTFAHFVQALILLSFLWIREEIEYDNGWFIIE